MHIELSDLKFKLKDKKTGNIIQSDDVRIIDFRTKTVHILLKNLETKMRSMQDFEILL